MRKRNRNYKPRILQAPPGEQGTLPVMFGLSQEVRNSMYLALFGMMEAMTTGQGTEEHGHSLNSACQLAEIISRTDSPRAQQICKDACLYAAAVKINGDAGFGWKMDEIQATYIGRAISYLAHIQSIIPRREMKQHIATLDRENRARLKQQEQEADNDEPRPE